MLRRQLAPISLIAGSMLVIDLALELAQKACDRGGKKPGNTGKHI